MLLNLSGMARTWLSAADEERERRTVEALLDPKVGDLFCEHYTFWLYVLERDGDQMTTIEASAPCTFPEDGVIRTVSVAEFATRFQTSAGPWVFLYDRDRCVEGWIDRGRREP